MIVGDVIIVRIAKRTNSNCPRIGWIHWASPSCMCDLEIHNRLQVESSSIQGNPCIQCCRAFLRTRPTKKWSRYCIRQKVSPPLGERICIVGSNADTSKGSADCAPLQSLLASSTLTLTKLEFSVGTVPLIEPLKCVVILNHVDPRVPIVCGVVDIEEVGGQCVLPGDGGHRS